MTAVPRPAMKIVRVHGELETMSTFYATASSLLSALPGIGTRGQSPEVKLGYGSQYHGRQKQKKQNEKNIKFFVYGPYL